MSEYPSYLSIKSVEGFRIGSIQSVVDGNEDQCYLLVSTCGQYNRTVSAQWLGRHKPVVGGCWVRYKDGYESYSPYESFRDGYVSVDETGMKDKIFKLINEMEGSGVDVRKLIQNLVDVMVPEKLLSMTVTDKDTVVKARELIVARLFGLYVSHHSGRLFTLL